MSSILFMKICFVFCFVGLNKKSIHYFYRNCFVKCNEWFNFWKAYFYPHIELQTESRYFTSEVIFIKQEKKKKKRKLTAQLCNQLPCWWESISPPHSLLVGWYKLSHPHISLTIFLSCYFSLLHNYLHHYHCRFVVLPINFFN